MLAYEDWCDSRIAMQQAILADRRISDEAKNWYHSLFLHCLRDGEWCISVERVGIECCQSRSAAYRSYKQLREHGYVKRIGKKLVIVPRSCRDRSRVWDGKSPTHGTAHKENARAVVLREKEQEKPATAILPTAPAPEPDAALSHEGPKPEPARVAEVTDALVAMVKMPEATARRYALSTEYVFALAYLALIANILARRGPQIENPIGLARSVFDRPQQYPEYRAFLPHARVSREIHKPEACRICGEPDVPERAWRDGCHLGCVPR